MSHESAIREFLSWALAFMVAITVGVFVHVFVMEPFEVDGSSMEPSFFSGDRVLLSKISYHLSSPRRGDVVVFHYPADPTRDFIKRVIGLPGDTVQVHNGYVYVNGRTIQEDYLRSFPLEEFPSARVPTDSYFVLGDNRNNSMDSRDSHVGFVQSKYLVGKVEMVYWPLQDFRVLRAPDYRG